MEVHPAGRNVLSTYEETSGTFPLLARCLRPSVASTCGSFEALTDRCVYLFTLPGEAHRSHFDPLQVTGQACIRRSLLHMKPRWSRWSLAMERSSGSLPIVLDDLSVPPDDHFLDPRKLIPVPAEGHPRAEDLAVVLTWRDLAKDVGLAGLDACRHRNRPTDDLIQSDDHQI
jgi:hypothetical protein